MRKEVYEGWKELKLILGENLYEKYNNLNNMLVIYVEDLAKKEFDGEDEETVINMLSSFKSNLEYLFDKCNAIEAEDDNIKDLKYFLFDALLFTRDVIAFYKVKEFARIKMRITNYVAKKRRAEMFQR